MRFHLEMEAQRLTSQRGLDPREARRQAAIAFGGLEKYQGASRDVLGFTALRGVSLDVRLAARMLMKFPGLTIAGGLALALAIGVGAAWFDVTSNVLRPAVPLPDGDRLVEIEVRDAAGGSDERRILHDFLTWRRDLTLVEDIGAYRTLERNLIQGDADPQPLTVAEITSSAFRVARVAPLLGRTLIDADERPGALPVAVLGYDVWQRRFGGEAAAIGRTIQLGRATMTIVGVMPQHFAFPINHRVWVPLQLRPEGYAPLEGPGVRVFGRLALGIAQAEAYAQVTALAGRIAAASPATHEHLRPRILAYGGESPGDRSWLELAVTHLPVLLVLVIACANVGTLIYARTATRDAEIAMRYALGASRGRIVGQLFVEALVLAAVAAAIGLMAAQIAVTWGMAAFFSAQPGGMPFWIEPGLQFTTVLYAALLTVSGAVILGALPALKVTGRKVQSQLKNMGAGGSTLRFGWVWTGAMIGQVAITVICLPPAMGATEEVVRDRIIRSRFPAERYLAVRVDLDRETPPAVAGNEVPAATTRRVEQAFEEFARRVALQPDVVAVTFGDRLPGMSPSVRRAEVETAPDQPPVPVPNMWTSAVGFELFDIPLVMGRAFHDGDRAPAARTVLVNEAFARRYAGGSSPVGRRVRYVGAGESGREPWLEIVGVVRDIGLNAYRSR